MESAILTFLAACLITWLHDVTADESVTREVCNMEQYNATCPGDQVILMERARFGRMRKGRCVKQDLGFLGCEADVFGVLDPRCSGRHECLFQHPDPTLHNTKACPEDTTPYLEVTYKCLTVSQLERVPPRCTPGQPVLLRDPSGYISGALTSRWNVGTPDCPWRIQVATGQRIKLTKYNFDWMHPSAGSADHSSSGVGGALGLDPESLRPETCMEYATIKEDGKLVKRLSLCSGESREAVFHTTSSNQVDVSLLSAGFPSNKAAFLLKYQAVGCPDLPPPVSGRVTRKGDNVTITCDNGNEVWYLTCKDTKWQGQSGNCTKGGMSQSPFEQPADFPFGILLVVAIGVALGVFLGGLLLILAVIYMKRKHRSQQYAHDDFHHSDTLHGPRTMTPAMAHHHYPEHKTAAMMINIHSSDDSPHWDHHISKSMGSADDLCRDPGACRSCALPCSQQQLIALGAPPGERTATHVLPPHQHHVTGPRDIHHSYGVGAGDGGATTVVTRQHVYECPKFNS